MATMAKYWPQIDIDGVLNIWIVKPGNKCRGRGIQLMNNIKDIIGLINIPAQKTRYVVQKYIGIVELGSLLNQRMVRMLTTCIYLCLQKIRWLSTILNLIYGSGF